MDWGGGRTQYGSARSHFLSSRSACNKEFVSSADDGIGTRKECCNCIIKIISSTVLFCALMARKNGNCDVERKGARQKKKGKVTAYRVTQ